MQAQFSALEPGPCIVYHRQSIAAKTEGIFAWQPNRDTIIQLADHPFWLPSISPDGLKIVYGSFYNNGLWLHNLKTSTTRQLTQSGMNPAFSPDSKQIVYIDAPDGDPHVGINRKIFLFDLETASSEQLSDIPGSGPSFSPDGKKIIFHGEANAGAYLYDFETGATKLIALNALYPVYSPDGKSILFATRDWRLAIMDATTYQVSKNFPDQGYLGSWSPDGSQIVYQYYMGDGPLNIINKDGSEKAMIDVHGRNPFWGMIKAPEPEDETRIIPDPLSSSGSLPATVPDQLMNRKVWYNHEITIAQKEIEIEVWDHNQYDGDIISLNLNGTWVVQKAEITPHRQVFKIVLEENALNSLILFAENEGRLPPNTASIAILDGDRKTIMELSADMQNCSGVKLRQVSPPE